jgi:hypothetical protein
MTGFPNGNRSRRSRIAQLVEQLTVNQRVVGSSPTSGAISNPYGVRVCFFVRP